MVTAAASDIGRTNISELKFSAIWCPATFTMPSGETSRATTANRVTSKNSASAMGSPSCTRRIIMCQSGVLNERSLRISRRERACLTKVSMLKNITQYTAAVATPQPTPPSSGMPKWP